MDNKKSMELFSKAPVSKAVFKNALQAMGAATSSLIINVSRQGVIFIPALFLLKVMMGMPGLVWAQPVADIISLLIACILYRKTVKKMLVQKL